MWAVDAVFWSIRQATKVNGFKPSPSESCRKCSQVGREDLKIDSVLSGKSHPHPHSTREGSISSPIENSVRGYIMSPPPQGGRGSYQSIQFSQLGQTGWVGLKKSMHIPTSLQCHTFTEMTKKMKSVSRIHHESLIVSLFPFSHSLCPFFGKSTSSKQLQCTKLSELLSFYIIGHHLGSFKGERQWGRGREMNGWMDE